MRRNVLALVFAAAILVALAVPLFSGGGRALAVPLHQHLLDTPGAIDIKVAQGLCTAAGHGQHDTAFHNFHSNVHVGVFIDGNNPNTVTTTSC
jgi:hypothetical protein